MNDNKIKNVIFDVGNVLVRWSPVEIIKLTFGDSVDVEEKVKLIFSSELWLALNRGEISEFDAKAMYIEQFLFSEASIEQLFYYIKHTQIQLYGTVVLLKKLKMAGYKTYALTDNVAEIVHHLKEAYDFWPLFDGAIVSAEVGCLKPHAEIFHHLLNDYSLNADESVFLDDMKHNVKGAQRVGFATVHFKNVIQAEEELRALGLEF